MKKVPAKRVNVVSLRMVRESTVLYAGRSVQAPDEAAGLLRQFIGNLDREAFVVIGLDIKHQPTVLEIVSLGTVSSTLVHPREVFKTAILSNSSALILGHVHPSGIPDPSEDDIAVTRRLVDAGKILGIEILDHVILGGGESFKSLRQLGLM